MSNIVDIIIHDVNEEIYRHVSTMYVVVVVVFLRDQDESFVSSLSIDNQLIFLCVMIMSISQGHVSILNLSIRKVSRRRRTHSINVSSRHT
jgi:integral membrane sensor domain MASE1